MVVGNGTVSIPIERHNAVYKVPDFFVVGMEDVGSILMNVNALHIFAIDISTQMRAFVNYKAFLSLFSRFVSKCCSKEARTNYEIIVHI